MKQVIKYALLVLGVFAMAWVFASRFTKNEIALAVTGLSAAALGLVAFRKLFAAIPLYKCFLLVMSFTLMAIPALGPREQDSFEKRKLADFPEFRISNVWKFLFGYDSYFSDRFAFRNDAVEFYGRWRLRLFRTSPMPDLVAVGKNDWLFRSNEDYIAKTSTPWTKEQLDTVVTNLEIVTKYLDLRGIRYYFAMIPVKERIYSEYVPPHLRYKMRYSRAAALMQELRNHPSVRNIDCHDTLVEGKKTLETYYNTDTHWTEYGAFLGYRKIMERIRQDYPSLEIIEMEEFDLDSLKHRAGDLQQQMGFSGEIVITRYYFTKKTGPKLLVADSTMYHTSEVQYNVRELAEKKYGLNLFLIRDSFSEHLRTFILHNFDRSVLAWTPAVPVANIIRESPDIVVHEMLEMFSPHLLSLPPEIASDSAFLKTHFPGYLKQ